LQVTQNECKCKIFFLFIPVLAIVWPYFFERIVGHL
jgi:hypothetical protein